jgi:hypothetical protein
LDLFLFSHCSFFIVKKKFSIVFKELFLQLLRLNILLIDKNWIFLFLIDLAPLWKVLYCFT